jgi:hypothetical protein
MDTVDDLITALGGTTAVAVLLAVRPSAVSNWRRLNSLPPRLFVRFRKICAENGIALNETVFREVLRTDRAPATEDVAAEDAAG